MLLIAQVIFQYVIAEPNIAAHCSHRLYSNDNRNTTLVCVPFPEIVQSSEYLDQPWTSCIVFDFDTTNCTLYLCFNWFNVVFAIHVDLKWCPLVQWILITWWSVNDCVQEFTLFVDYTLYTLHQNSSWFIGWCGDD